MEHEIIENIDGSVLFETYETEDFVAQRFLDGKFTVKFKEKARAKVVEIYKNLMEDVSCE